MTPDFSLGTSIFHVLFPITENHSGFTYLRNTVNSSDHVGFTTNRTFRENIELKFLFYFSLIRYYLDLKPFASITRYNMANPNVEEMIKYFVQLTSIIPLRERY